MSDENEPSIDRTQEFPWGSRAALTNYYTTSLTNYLDIYFSSHKERVHITDFAVAVSTFNDAWWSIYQDFDFRDYE